MSSQLKHLLTAVGRGSILWLYATYGGAAAVSTPATEDTEAGHVSTSPALQRCSGQESCPVVAAAIGSLVAGLIVGVLVTYLVGVFLRKRKRSLPAKDYDVTEESHCDVTRTDDGADLYSVQGQASPGVKGHKKLERLVQQSPTSPGDTEFSSAAAPLIPGGPQDEGAATAPRSAPTNLAEPINDVIEYANVGAGAADSQPYETLDIIAEESEYCIPRTIDARPASVATYILASVAK